MNALDLLHKIRTCDRHGNFTYADITVLNDLIEMIHGAEAKASEIATERERGRCREIIVQMRNQRQAYRQIIGKPRAQLPQYQHWAQTAIDDLSEQVHMAKAIAEARQHGCHYAECDECSALAVAVCRAISR